MFKKILVSVSDKTNLIELIQPLFERGAEIVSTGGTAKYLRENKIKVTDISELTNFPEILAGRVKTLHPMVHMSLLARKDHPEDVNTLKKYNAEMFDLVVCNLYPFENKLNANANIDELIENIDIGGVTLLRASAKNFKHITVVCDPKDYSLILTLKPDDLATRRKLAVKAFTQTSFYDSLISKGLEQDLSSEFQFDDQMTLGFRKKMDLRYGENPHQKAHWYYSSISDGLHQAEIIQGKELSFNNLIDISAAVGVVTELESPAAVGIKHTNPCGVGTGMNILQATTRMLESDPKSIFGGIVAVNETVELSSAQKLAEIFLECIIAPDYTKEALEAFSTKKNLRILKWANLKKAKMNFELKSIYGGLLIQKDDELKENISNFKIYGANPSEGILKDIRLGITVAKWLKSNAIAIVKDGMTLGLGMGQVNRVDAVEHAIRRWKQFHPNVKNPILVSDGFFPFSDSVSLASDYGIQWVIEPGGSLKDNEVIIEAERKKINLILTGTRHFRH